ncbi:hypothetical protein PRZ48_008665 [Zasmidium cellare]|uniref:Uncharacterized protein n=1 Tax=Zasmidium cellare TaxID=395010 RepID=A0ABR0EG35_ZASCE|nr:hypothetical protein PRZ48_008665 [Zasmidium cellare]
MARYPTFDEYAKRGAYVEGINRCNELLQRSPKDLQLLLVKLQLLSVSGNKSDETLDQLLAITPPIQDVRELVPIEAAVVDGNKDAWPRPTSAGPQVAKLWDNAFKANTSMNYRLDLVTVRFSRAVLDDRIQDAQQSLIVLKSVQPKNRAIYMAHAAYTQLLSNSKDDLQSRLALSLAKKAVADKFDDDRALDCRVAGQIFARQGASIELETIRERPSLRESQQVYEALKLSQKVDLNGSAKPEKADPSNVNPRIWLESEVEVLKDDFAKLIQANASHEALVAFIVNAIRLFHTSITSLDLGGRDRGAADACFLAVSGLVKLYADTNDTTYLIQAAFLSQRLLKHNEHIHEARLVLVYLYMRLNLGSLALRVFDSLNVKEIQHDTVGHSIFTNLSITHPFWTQLPVRDWFEPHERTHKALGVYPRHEDKLADTEAGILEHSQTGMVFDLHELRVNLRLSFVRRLILLEHRRIARLTGKGVSKSVSDVGPRVVANWIDNKDNRDFNATFDYEFNVETAVFPENDQASAQASLLADLSADAAWSLATGKPATLILDPENLKNAQTLATRASKSPAKTLANIITQRTISILIDVKAGTSPTKDTISSLQKAVTDLNISTLTNTSDSLAEHLQEHYLFVDILRIVIAACTYIKKHAEHIPMEVASLQETARKDIDTLQKHARAQTRSIKASAVKEMLTKHADLKPALDLFGGENLHLFSSTLAESAKEGWEGVCSINASA